jgi:hypothetical protein
VAILDEPIKEVLKVKNYINGEWVDSKKNSTDYDVFVYDPEGSLETYHTESAGLMEHLARVYQPLFTPKENGNCQTVNSL